MSDNTAQNNRRIAKNTLMLYFRQILIMFVGLYTVRIVLNTLGVENYGIYNVVAGFVTMFGFLSGAMMSASQRYFSFELGKNDLEQLKKTFSVSMAVYFMLSVIILIFSETVGLWFVNEKLIIPLGRMYAANWIYQLSIISFLITILTTPFMASIIAHEYMNIYAWISIIEVLLKLVIVFLLQVLSGDKLILYGTLLLFVTFISTSIYRAVCRRKFIECRYKFYWNKALFKELTSYVGWNLFGNLASVLRNQGINIVLNLFFGPVVNAARGVAFQVKTAVNSFSQNFSTAVRPQLIKDYANNKHTEMMKLLYRSCKGTFFLMYVFILPLILELNTVLELWLVTFPDFTITFTALMLFDATIESIQYPLMTAAQATGKIKLYQSVVGGVLLLNIPVSYIALKMGAPAYSVVIVSIFLTILSAVLRLFIVKLLMDFSISAFFRNVLIPLLIVVLSSSIMPTLFVHYFSASVLRLFLTIIISVLCIVSASYFFGLNKNEKKYILNYVKSKFKKNMLKGVK